MKFLAVILIYVVCHLNVVDTTTAPSPTATTPGIRKNNTSGLKSGLIALGIFAVIAAFVAAIFLLLYLR